MKRLMHVSMQAVALALSACNNSNDQQMQQMAGWFSGNRNMFGLIEEDLSQIESNHWTQPR